MSKFIGIAAFDYTAYTDGGGHEWQSWLRSFEWYLKANKIEDDHEKFVKLMHIAGQKVQELFATLPVPESVNKVPRGPLKSTYMPHLTEYEMAVAKLNDHFQPKKNLTYERHEFRQIKQESDEKIAFFVMRLRKQAERCDFGDKFEDQVKDQIIEKCISKKLRLKLLSLGDAGLEAVMREAKAFEAVQEQSEALNDTPVDRFKAEEVNKIETRPKPIQPPNSNKMECYRCGYTGHRQYDDKCPAKGKICNKCGGRNHFSRKCKSQKRIRNPNSNPPQNATESYGKDVKPESDEPSAKKDKTDENETVKLVETYKSNLKDEYLFCITDNKLAKQNEITCKIGNVTTTVVLDSGSRYNIVDSKDWEFLKMHKIDVISQCKDADQGFKAYGGYPLTVVGTFKAKIETTYNSCVADFYVLKDYGKILIGYETGIPLGVIKIGENVNQITKSVPLSKIKGVIVDIPIDEGVKPVAQPYRRIPVPLEEAVDAKIEELLEQEIIEKVM